MIERTIPAIAKINIKYGTAVIAFRNKLSLVRTPIQIEEEIIYIMELINPKTPAGLLRINDRIAQGIIRAMGITNIIMINEPAPEVELLPKALPKPEINLPIVNTLKPSPNFAMLGRIGKKKDIQAIAPIII